jgi:zinc D-Ala-D-Ala carboxypeptidase
MLLSPNFSLEELTVSEAAVRQGIGNEPNEDVIDNLKALCTHILEPLRTLVGAPILITSGYRSPFLNQYIGGAKTSQHVYGQAADLHTNKMTVEELYQLIKRSNLPYSQVIQEFSKWVHVSFDNGRRHESLRATKDEQGKTIYAHD